MLLIGQTKGVSTSRAAAMKHVRWSSRDWVSFLVSQKRFT